MPGLLTVDLLICVLPSVIEAFARSVRRATVSSSRPCRTACVALAGVCAFDGLSGTRFVELGGRRRAAQRTQEMSSIARSPSRASIPGPIGRVSTVEPLVMSWKEAVADRERRAAVEENPTGDEFLVISAIRPP